MMYVVRAVLVLCAFSALSFAQGRSSTFTDSRDGKTYRIVQMPDGKWWMAANLNFAISGGSWCYDNNAANCETYGRLYDWNTARAACPAGWRLPSAAEWNALITAAGGEQTAGRKLRSRTGWRNWNDGTDEFGFSALPGGRRFFSNGSFDMIGEKANWWSASAGDASGTAQCVDTHYDDEDDEEFVFVGEHPVGFGYSIRCIRD